MPIGVDQGRARDLIQAGRFPGGELQIDGKEVVLKLGEIAPADDR
ncbi:MAG: hypothetical protein WBL40_01070 [Terrimicrobiaceae bacterium]